MWLFLAFLLVPLIEIALFIQVGGAIGLWPTLAVVVITAFLGTILVRSQGTQVLTRLRRSLDEFADPTEPLAHGAMILFSGALLLAGNSAFGVMWGIGGIVGPSIAGIAMDLAGPEGLPLTLGVLFGVLGVAAGLMPLSKVISEEIFSK